MIADPAEIHDPAYLDGLRSAVSAALDYGLAAIRNPDATALPVPPALLAQARLAARRDIGLDVVVRRYVGGHALLGDLLIEEAEQGGLEPRELKGLLRGLSACFDRLLAAVSTEFQREKRDQPPTSKQRRLELVRGLLDGELVEASRLGYETDAHHLALVSMGPGAGEAIHRAAASLDRCLLIADVGEGALWAWLGGRRALEDDRLGELAGSLSRAMPASCVIALGESAQGLGGWRLSHRQAAAALPIARRRPEPVVRYADVALLASALQDDVLRTSLRRRYLKPLERERDGGDVARQTLRAYFSAGQNLSSAAAALGLSRPTVRGRLRAIEERLGRPLDTCTSELDVALRVEKLTDVTAAAPAPGNQEGDLPDRINI